MESISLIFGVLLQVYLIYLSLFIGSKTLDKYTLRLSLVNTAVVSLVVCILSVIFGVITIAYFNTVCNIQDGIECGNIAWIIFGFFVFSPIFAIIAGVVTKFLSPKIFTNTLLSTKIFSIISIIFVISNILFVCYLGIN